MYTRPIKHAVLFTCTTFALAAFLLVVMVVTPQTGTHVYAAETVEELRAKIRESQAQLKEIEKEIKKFEAQLNEVGAEKKTLQNAIKELDLARQKLQTSIRATQQKINSTDLEIDELQREIRVKKLEIERTKEVLAETFRSIDQMERQTPVEMFLGFDSIAEVWDVIIEQEQVQESLREDLHALTALKEQYERARDQAAAKRAKLHSLKQELSGEKSAVEGTITQKDQLLDKTKNKEAEYQRILEEKRAAREKFEKEMATYEAQLQFILDPSTIPSPGSGVLRWPLGASYMANCAARKSTFGNEYCITQYFGNTAFAKSGAYNGKGHNGVDFGVPIGTKVYAALAGTVVETGNTDVGSCLSYGQWILIKHDNGLSTLYAHLNSRSVVTGQRVETGQLIGFSGNTGYSTGPHLHFTVYASKGVNVVKLGDVKAITSCPNVRVPVAGYEAYLNPLDYL